MDIEEALFILNEGHIPFRQSEEGECPYCGETESGVHRLDCKFAIAEKMINGAENISKH